MAKKALLIGINHYQIPGNDLRGCVNDVKSMQATLKKYYGFKSADMTTLLDDQATTKAMRTEIQKLVTRAKAGDLLLHYSRHGLNVSDKNGDKADHRNESLCPTDLNRDDPLTDDWLRRTFDKLHPQASLTVIFDCCHSGTTTRAMNFDPKALRSKYLASPWDLMAVEMKKKLTGTTGGMRGELYAAGAKRADVVTARIAEVLIAGCPDTQISADDSSAVSSIGRCRITWLTPSRKPTASSPTVPRTNKPSRPQGRSVRAGFPTGGSRREPRPAIPVASRVKPEGEEVSTRIARMDTARTKA